MEQTHKRGETTKRSRLRLWFGVGKLPDWHYVQLLLPKPIHYPSFVFFLLRLPILLAKKYYVGASEFFISELVKTPLRNFPVRICSLQSVKKLSHLFFTKSVEFFLLTLILFVKRSNGLPRRTTWYSSVRRPEGAFHVLRERHTDTEGAMAKRRTSAAIRTAADDITAIRCPRDRRGGGIGPGLVSVQCVRPECIEIEQ